MARQLVSTFGVDKALQNFVYNENTLLPTMDPGAPIAGAFYSSITSRKPIQDLTKDGQVRFGVKRIMTPVVMQIPDESGGLGRLVHGTVGDEASQIRFIGSWLSLNDQDGPRVQTTVPGNYIEVTFYGTGLNMMTGFNAQANDYRVAVDGGPSGLNVYPGGAASSAVLNQRNYSTNQVISLVSGLPLGVHTVEISFVSGAFLVAYGFEILNERANLLVSPASYYILGKTASSPELSASLNTGFDNIYGTPGTRGGRVLVQKNLLGETVKDIQYTNPATQLGNLADHSNEEISRVIYVREFGAGRADDYSSLIAGNASVAFTLDDGVTTLMSTSASIPLAQQALLNANNSTTTITFVGTGLDIEISDTANGGADATQHTYQIDGGAATNWFYTSGNTATRMQKVVSGLPYGTHTIRFNRLTPATWAPYFYKFIVYQPKTPPTAANMTPVAAYNLMADVVANNTAGIARVSTGILRKQLSQREGVYVGTWTTTLDTTQRIGGWSTLTTTATNYVEYTFFGTGFDLRFLAAATRSTSITVRLNGNLATSANFPTASFGVYGIPNNYNTATAVLNQNNPTTTAGAGFYVTNLPLATYTVRLTNNNGGQDLQVDTLDIFTPVYSPVSMLPFAFRNTLMIGNNSLDDVRALTPLRDVTAKQKNIAQAAGIITNPTTSSTSPVPLPDLSVTHLNSSGRIKISYNVKLQHGTTDGVTFFAAYINGVRVTTVKIYQAYNTGGQGTAGDSLIVPVAPGVHKIDVYWFVSLGTATATAADRNLTVEEV